MIIVIKFWVIRTGVREDRPKEQGGITFQGKRCRRSNIRLPGVAVVLAAVAEAGSAQPGQACMPTGASGLPASFNNYQ